MSHSCFHHVSGQGCDEAHCHGSCFTPCENVKNLRNVWFSLTKCTDLLKCFKESLSCLCFVSEAKKVGQKGGRLKKKKGNDEACCNENDQNSPYYSFNVSGCVTLL